MTSPSPSPSGLYLDLGDGDYRAATPREILLAARAAIDVLYKERDLMWSDGTARNYFIAKFAPLPHDCFALALLDHKCRLIDYVELDQGHPFASDHHGYLVPPRRLVLEVLSRDCSAVIAARRQRAGTADPTNAELVHVPKLKELLRAMHVHLMDYLVVGSESVYSFADHRQL